MTPALTRATVPLAEPPLLSLVVLVLFVAAHAVAGPDSRRPSQATSGTMAKGSSSHK